MIPFSLFEWIEPSYPAGHRTSHNQLMCLAELCLAWQRAAALGYAMPPSCFIWLRLRLVVWVCPTYVIIGDMFLKFGIQSLFHIITSHYIPNSSTLGHLIFALYPLLLTIIDQYENLWTIVG